MMLSTYLKQIPLKCAALNFFPKTSIRQWGVVWWNLFDNKQVALCVMRGCTGLINRSQLSKLFKHLYVLMPIFWENMGIRLCRKYTQHVLLIRGSCSLVHTHTAVTKLHHADHCHHNSSGCDSSIDKMTKTARGWQFSLVRGGSHTPY